MTTMLPDRDVYAGLLSALDPSCLAVMTDAQIAVLTDWSDEGCVVAAMVEGMRRDAAEPGPWAPARLTATDTAEQEFAAYAEASYLAAERETCGHMLSRVGRAAGTDPRDLFRGTEAWARKHGSWELGEFWDRHGRLTVTAFRQGMAGARAGSVDATLRRFA